MSDNAIRYTDWADFANRFLTDYHKLSRMRRRQLVFRGQSDARWPLLTSLDRLESFASAAQRQQRLTQLISRFRTHVHAVNPSVGLHADDEWELFGRHHGLPTSVLDFSYSPYVAAYFAFQETPPAKSTHSAIWMLDRDEFDNDTMPQVAIIDTDDRIRFNPRAQLQDGLFVKMKDVGPVEKLLAAHLTRHEIPNGRPGRATALAALDAMLINARNMFRDLDAAAKSAATDVLILSES